MQGFALQLNSTPNDCFQVPVCLKLFESRQHDERRTSHQLQPCQPARCTAQISKENVLIQHKIFHPGLKFWASIDSCDHGTTIEVQWVWSSLGSQYSMIHTVSKMRPPLLFGLDAACMQPHRCANKYPKYAKYHATHWDSHLFVGEQQLQLLMPDFCGPASARFRGYCDDIVSLKIQCNHQSTKSSPNPSAQPPASKAGPNHLWYDDKPEVLAKLQRIQIRD